MSHPSLPFSLSFSSDEFTAGTEVRVRSTKRLIEPPPVLALADLALLRASTGGGEMPP